MECIKMNPIEKRFIEVEETIVANNPECQVVEARTTSKYYKLHAVLPVKFKSMLREFEDLMSKKAYLEARIMYEQGLNDGMEVPVI